MSGLPFWTPSAIFLLWHVSEPIRRSVAITYRHNSGCTWWVDRAGPLCPGQSRCAWPGQSKVRWTEQDLSGAPDQDKAKLGLTHAWEERASSGLGLSPSSAFFLGWGRPGACPPPPHGLLPLLAFVHIKFYFVRSGPSYRLFFSPSSLSYNVLSVLFGFIMFIDMIGIPSRAHPR